MNRCGASTNAHGKRSGQQTVCIFKGGERVVFYYLEGNHLRWAHCHVISRDGKYEAVIDLRTLEVVGGKLPPSRRGRIIRKWLKANRETLMENWVRARSGEELIQMKPPR